MAMDDRCSLSARLIVLVEGRDGVESPPEVDPIEDERERI